MTVMYLPQPRFLLVSLYLIAGPSAIFVLNAIVDAQLIPFTSAVTINFNLTGGNMGGSWATQYISQKYTLTQYSGLSSSIPCYHGIGNIRNLSISPEYVSVFKRKVTHIVQTYGGTPTDVSAVAYNRSRAFTGESTMINATQYANGSEFLSLKCSSPDSQVTPYGCLDSSSATTLTGCLAGFTATAPKCTLCQYGYSLVSFFSF